ncbi:MAG: ScaI family restriction endonuclease [Cyanobacteria bacterium SBLK]|nr:ScaI family restriction endonuclease [Cyanobacteria bacterium SBLK]
MISPYSHLPQDKWLNKTHELIAEHPLKEDIIKQIILESWTILWDTKIGNNDLKISIQDIDLPAQIVGYFLEKIFAKILETRYPQEWQGGKNKEDKDIIYLPDDRFSLEIKTSGQKGLKIFGNRSYGQKTKNENLEKKSKSGYYITVNFFDQTINLIRFGWIDFDDWKAQKSQTGQAASLSDYVYQYKLVEIPGEYRLNAPLEILEGVGGKTAKKLSLLGINILQDLLKYKGNDTKAVQLRKVLIENIEKYGYQNKNFD